MYIVYLHITLLITSASLRYANSILARIELAGGNTSFVLPAALSASALLYCGCSKSFNLLLCNFDNLCPKSKILSILGRE